MKRHSRFSKIELKHLIISVLVMSVAVAIWARSFFMLPIAFLAVGPGFVFHEMGHKFAAQRYGYFAEYRMWGKGLILALITAFIGFLIIAPGAVYFSSKGVHGSGSDEKIGKIGLAGPVVNLFLVFVFGGIFFAGTDLVRIIGFFGAYVNSWLALFNLIPIPPFDGQKIMYWNKFIWFYTMGLAIASFALVYSWGSLI